MSNEKPTNQEGQANEFGQQWTNAMKDVEFAGNSGEKDDKTQTIEMLNGFIKQARESGDDGDEYKEYRVNSELAERISTALGGFKKKLVDYDYGTISSKYDDYLDNWLGVDDDAITEELEKADPDADFYAFDNYGDYTSDYYDNVKSRVFFEKLAQFSDKSSKEGIEIEDGWISVNPDLAGDEVSLYDYDDVNAHGFTHFDLSYALEDENGEPIDGTRYTRSFLVDEKDIASSMTVKTAEILLDRIERGAGNRGKRSRRNMEV